jgi:hypothetical protein
MVVCRTSITVIYTVKLFYALPKNFFTESSFLEMYNCILEKHMTNPVQLKDDSHYIRSHKINFSPVPVVQDNECGKFFRLHFFRNVSFYKEPPIAAKLRVEWDRGGQRGRVGGVV